MVLIIGHRGAAGLEPENTLRSFGRALELGVDRIETDVRLTKDGHPVLVHDATVDRTTDGTGPVRDLTLKEIRELDAGRGERVPTLRELLALAGGKVGLNLELKDGDAAEIVLRLLRESGVQDVLLTSGDAEVLMKVRRLAPQVPTEHIFGKPPDDAVHRALTVGAEYVSCHIAHLCEDFVSEAHRHGLKVVAWPPDTPEEMKRAAGLGVDLICTDRPDLAVNLRNEGEI